MNARITIPDNGCGGCPFEFRNQHTGERECFMAGDWCEPGNYVLLKEDEATARYAKIKEEIAELKEEKEQVIRKMQHTFGYRNVARALVNAT